MAAWGKVMFTQPFWLWVAAVLFFSARASLKGMITGLLLGPAVLCGMLVITSGIEGAIVGFALLFPTLMILTPLSLLVYATSASRKRRSQEAKGK